MSRPDGVSIRTRTASTIERRRGRRSWTLKHRFWSCVVQQPRQHETVAGSCSAPSLGASTLSNMEPLEARHCSLSPASLTRSPSCSGVPPPRPSAAKQPPRPLPAIAEAKARNRSAPPIEKTGTRFSRRKAQSAKSDKTAAFSAYGHIRPAKLLPWRLSFNPQRERILPCLTVLSFSKPWAGQP